ncbi:mRNA-capping enzyme subunit beta [Grifola frondosa]|uniref:mRNA-capping enzyme subunit beta n=1 Tax=Grifola frondosa TaxID=5627 RepID=A0A1C7LVB1_GRIFR|nr:mRNA-capping enzyme subunit beta [Grifola frondosa]
MVEDGEKAIDARSRESRDATSGRPRATLHVCTPSRQCPQQHEGQQHERERPRDAPSPLSLSILGVEPLDEFIREVADFVHFKISTRPPDTPGHIEVEAKIGVLRDREGGQRLRMPILVETILAPGAVDCRFESNMTPVSAPASTPAPAHRERTQAQHKHFNQLLNTLKTSSSTPLSYTHLRLVDSFYAADSGAGARGERIRVTRDEKSGAVVACVRKVRLGDLNIICPKRAADWRISVNLEIPAWHAPPIGTSTHTRRKDRMSYTHEEFVIDLTQVTASAGPSSKTEVLHELELELARPEYLLSTAAKRNDPNASEQERGAFDELMRRS